MCKSMMRLLLSATLILAFCHVLPVFLASAHATLPTRTRTYRFTARITDNAGVTPFKVGDLITGAFTYDLEATKEHEVKGQIAVYTSKRHSLTFKVGEWQFVGTGDVKLILCTTDSHEHFGIITGGVQAPKGWEIDPRGPSQSYGFTLQNAPPRKVLTRLDVPRVVSLADFETARQVKLDFYRGVAFPGGKVQGRATVYATVESLEAERR